MLLQGIRLPGLMSCMMFYWLVYIAAHSTVATFSDETSQSQPGLLLFILPGIGTALFNRKGALGTSLLGALLATPLCLLTFSACLTHYHGFWQELAYHISATFWCGSGAVGVLLWRAFSPM
ncbi:hypothetical protein ED28_10590 [[Pantoea] beijingensis]|uniref:Inner membrane protein YbjM n=1 Tax=[Pantoea] beijingensis TaxID=1324864 RepID=A0A443IDT6_9GAMM|nr:inner membrane protein YbjM [[Pantoea] beijingensis]RWR02070.1 hypothetical protein ED28_10590 [[Pantoea] beijingensis]